MRLRLSLITLSLLIAAGSLRADTPKPPNIVIFLADDLGWADCPLYGGKEVGTPNMNRLAAAGMRFTHAFVASPSCAPSRAALLTGLYPMRNGAMLNHSRPRAEVPLWPSYFRALGYQVVAIGKVAHYAQVKDYGFDHASHFNYHQDDCINAAVKWLAARKSDRPLCLLVGTNWPHVPWPKEGGPDPGALTLPLTWVDTPETRQARSRYLAAVANADRDLGLIYDAGVRTPLLVAWDGRVAPGSTSDALVSWIDLLPTCLEVAGKAPAGMDGRSFLSVLKGEKAVHRDKVFFTHSADGAMNRYPIRAVRTRGWSYIRNLNPDGKHTTHVDKAAAGDGRAYFDSWALKANTDNAAAAVVRRYHSRPAEELYDVNADPWQLKNLAVTPAHAETLKGLRTDLDRWMMDQGDEGLKTERALPEPRSKKKS